MIVIRVLPVLVFIAFSLPGIAQTDSILYSFFVAGHTYGKPGVNNVGLHPPFKQKFSYILSRPEIKFGVLTGDIVPPSPVIKDWDEVDADIDSLELPVFFAVGNHDMENRQLYEERYGRTYYSFLYQDDLYIVLDPNIDAWNISGNQLEFLKRTVMQEQAGVDNIFVFFHQILWWEENTVYKDYRPNSFAGKAASINFYTEIEPFFSNLDSPVFMFAGDFGAAEWSADFMYDTYSNISFIGSGMGEGPGDNFIVTNVKKDKTVSYNLICLNDTIANCFGNLTDYRLTPTHAQHRFEINRVLLYPNPSNGSFTLELKAAGQKDLKLVIYNSQGNIILHKQVFEGEKNRFTISAVNGIYLYRIEGKGKTLATGKLVVQD